MSDMANKVANNMLEFLLDPTVIPIKQRLYFGPEEKLQNEELDKARQDAQKAYKDQKNNSDFYPTRNRKQTLKEATVMDRKTLIASFDILAQNFAEEDPIAVDLRKMALALSRIQEPDFDARMAKAKTFPCPTCGTKVLEQTGYCVKCKKKVKPGAAKKAAEETCPDCDKAECTCPKKEAKEPPTCDKCGGKHWPFQKCQKKAEEMDNDKEPDNDKDDEKKASFVLDKTASEAIHLAVVRGLVAEVYSDEEPEVEPETEEPKKEEAPAPAPAPKEDVPAPAPAPEEEAPVPEKKPEEEDIAQKAAEKKDADQNSKYMNIAEPKKEKDAVAAPSPEPEKKPEEEDKQKDAAKPAPDAEKDEKEEPVDDSMLASSQVFNNVELTAPMMTADDIGVLSADEQSRLDSVMSSTLNLLSIDEKAKIEGLLK